MPLALTGVPLDTPATATLSCPHAEILQLTFEAAMGPLARDDLLPAGLAPTIPTLLTLLAVRVSDGPLGAFTFAQARVSCRSGVRARALVVASMVDGSAETARALRDGWGIGAEASAIVLDRRYDRVGVSVPAWGLVGELIDPAPINGADIQYVVGLHPVVTRAGETRLAQVEFDVAPERAERGRPVVDSYDGLRLAANGDGSTAAALRPTHPVAATIAVGAVTLPKVRFLLRPDVGPHLGTDVLS